MGVVVRGRGGFDLAELAEERRHIGTSGAAFRRIFDVVLDCVAVSRDQNRGG